MNLPMSYFIESMKVNTRIIFIQFNNPTLKKTMLIGQFNKEKEREKDI